MVKEKEKAKVLPETLEVQKEDMSKLKQQNDILKHQLGALWSKEEQDDLKWDNIKLQEERTT